MSFRPHYLPDLVVLSLCVVAVWLLDRWAADLGPETRRRVRIYLAVLLGLIGLGALMSPARVNRYLPGTLVAYVRCVAIFAAAWLLYATALLGVGRRVPAPSPGRRKVLRTAGVAALAAPAALAAVAYVKREELRFRVVDVPLPGHAAALNGLRITQVTDIHLGAFVGEDLLRRAVAMANESKPHLTLVTGDLINTKGDPLDECLKILSGLRAEAGVFGCNGNHEIYAEAQGYVQLEAARRGMRFLRSESVALQFGGATLNLSGIDYQRRGSPYLTGAEDLLLPGAYNLLMSHNPDLFPVAATKGFDLTVSGHTHGGQVHLEILHPSLNLVRFTTPYVYGSYQQDGRRLYVSRGIGTIGVPARLGAPPEVVCLRLCAT